MAHTDRIDALLDQLEAIRVRLDEIAAELRALRSQAAPSPSAAGLEAPPTPEGPPAQAGEPDAGAARRRLAALLGESAPPSPPTTPATALESGTASGGPAGTAGQPPAEEGGESGMFLDALDLSDDFRKVLSSVIRSGSVTAAQVASDTGEEEMAVKVFLKTLTHQGYVTREAGAGGVFLYRAVIRRKRKGLTQTGEDLFRRLDM